MVITDDYFDYCTNRVKYPEKLILNFKYFSE